MSCQHLSNSNAVRGADEYRTVTDMQLPTDVTLGGPPVALASYANDLQIKRDYYNGVFHRRALVMGLGQTGALSSLCIALRRHAQAGAAADGKREWHTQTAAVSHVHRRTGGGSSGKGGQGL